MGRKILIILSARATKSKYTEFQDISIPNNIGFSLLSIASSSATVLKHNKEVRPYD